jgi:hypothetical protein
MSVMNRMARVVTMALLGTLWWGCGGFSIPEARPHRPNVIIVLVDTLRADHMSTYGYTRPTTPYLDTLAETSFVFERARSQAACTFPSVNTLFTSRYAFDYYQLPEGEMGIPDRFPTIAELLHDQGYATAAVSASPIVRVTPSDHNPSAGFGAGFDVFDETCLWDTAACVNLRAQKLLADLEEPFFLYLHYMEPHSYYDPFRSRTCSSPMARSLTSATRTFSTSSTSTMTRSATSTASFNRWLSTSRARIFSIAPYFSSRRTTARSSWSTARWVIAAVCGTR